MLTFEQLKKIISLSKKLGLETELGAFFEKKNVVPLEEDLNSQDFSRIDGGLDLILLTFLFEKVVTTALIKASSLDNPFELLEGEFVELLASFAVELMKQYRSVVVANEILNKTDIKEFDEEWRVLSDWVDTLKQGGMLLLNVIDVIQKNSLDKLLSFNQQLIKQAEIFRINSEKLHRIPDDSLKQFSSIIMNSTQGLCHSSFLALGLEEDEAQVSSQADKKTLKPHYSGPVIPKKTGKIDADDSKLDKSTELPMQKKNKISERKTPAKTLEKLFEKSRYQQFALSGHNLVLKCARPDSPEDKTKQYADNLSALILSQQIMLSEAYIDTVSEEALRNDYIKVEEDNDSENKPDMNSIMSTSLEVLSVNEAAKPAIKSFEDLLGKIKSSVSSELVKVSPNIASLFVTLQQQPDVAFTDEFGKLLSRELPSLVEGLNCEPLNQVIKQFGGVERLQREIQTLPNQEWAKGIDKFLNSGRNAVQQTIKGFDLGAQINGADEFINKAKDIVEIFSEESLDNIWEQVSGGFKGEGTLLDFSGPILGTAIQQFLPAITREVFGNDEFGQAASSAISSALAGFSAGGPVGALVGAGISIVSSLFDNSGSSSQMISQLQGMEDRLQNTMHFISHDIKSFTSACIERVDQRMMRRFADLEVTLQQISEDIHVHIRDLGGQVNDGFKSLFNGLDKISVDMQSHALQLHRHIEHLARFNEERFDRLEGTVIHVGRFLSDKMDDHHRSQQSQMDRLEANLMNAIVKVNYNIEQQFFEQKALLLKLRSAQKKEHEVVRDGVDLILERQILLERIARDHRNETEKFATKILDELRAEGLWNPLLEIRRYAMSSSPALKLEKTKKYLLQLGDMSALVNTKAKTLDEKVYLLNSLAKLFLNLFYRCPSLWKDSVMQKPMDAIAQAVVDCFKEIAELPLKLSVELLEYQSVFYDFYHEVINEYVSRLSKSHRKDAGSADENEESALNKVELKGQAFKHWDDFKSHDPAFSEIKYDVGTYSARLNYTDPTRKIKILDATVSDDNTARFFSNEGGNMIVRRLDLGKTIDKLVESGKDATKLFSYPVLMADCREISVTDVKAEISYKKFIESCGDSDKTLGCSSQDYIIRYCEGNAASSSKIRIWNLLKFNDKIKEIVLPDECKRISAFSALVQRSQLIVLFLDLDNQVWLGSWDINTASVLNKPHKLAVDIDHKRVDKTSLLREWNGWLVVANSHLVDVRDLTLRHNPSISSAVFYNSDQDRVRMMLSSAGQNASGQVYYNFELQRFESTLPVSLTGWRDCGNWVFNNSKLTLSWPVCTEALRDGCLNNIKLLGRHANYSIYYTEENKVLLLRDFSETAQEDIDKLRANADKKIWDEYKKEVKTKWLDRLEGNLPGEARSELVEKMVSLKKRLTYLKENFFVYLRHEIQRNPELQLHINSALNGFELIDGFLQFESDKAFIVGVRQVLRECAYIQQQLSSSLKSGDIVDSRFPLHQQTLNALRRSYVFYDSSFDLLCHVKSDMGSGLVDLYHRALSIGIEFKMHLENKSNSLLSSSLEIKIFGKSYVDFCSNDKLFLDRFRGVGQHERVLTQFLDQLNQWLVDNNYRDKEDGKLTLRLLEKPGDKLIVFSNKSSEFIKKVHSNMASLLKIEIFTPSIQKNKSPKKQGNNAPTTYFFSRKSVQESSFKSDEVAVSGCMGGIM